MIDNDCAFANWLLHDYRIEFASLTAGTAFDAFALIKGMCLLLLARDRFHRTVSLTYHAACAHIRVDPVGYERLADTCWAFLIPDMSKVFLSEIFQG
jgi:hypothetical protein